MEYTFKKFSDLKIKTLCTLFVSIDEIQITVIMFVYDFLIHFTVE